MTSRSGLYDARTDRGICLQLCIIVASAAPLLIAKRASRQPGHFQQVDQRMVLIDYQYGVCYPKWRFDAPPERLARALRPFIEAKPNCWVIHSFMMGRFATLHGDVLANLILDRTHGLGAAINLAEQWLDCETGAM